MVVSDIFYEGKDWHFTLVPLALYPPNSLSLTL